jgi:hypothetical protein
MKARCLLGLLCFAALSAGAVLGPDHSAGPEAAVEAVIQRLLGPVKSAGES